MDGISDNSKTVMVEALATVSVNSMGVIARSGEVREETVERANALVATGKFRILTEVIAEPEVAEVAEAEAEPEAAPQTERRSSRRKE